MSSQREERVLVFAPLGANPELDRALGACGISWEVFSSLAALCAALPQGAGALLFAPGWSAASDLHLLYSLLEHQPLWSELTILLLKPDAPEDPARRERLGQVTRLEWPPREGELASAVRSALRARRRQYQLREHLQAGATAEHTLRKNAERLRLSLEAGRLGFWQHDLTTDQLYCSDECKTHFGRAAEDALTHAAVLAAVHPEDRERARQAISEAIGERAGYVLEYRVLWPDGSLHWLMVRGHASYDASGQPESTFGVTQEITQRKDAEARQAEQAERLRLLSESAGHLLSTTDPAGMIRDLFNRIRESLRLDLCLNYLAEPGGTMLRLASHAGISPDQAEQIGTLQFGEAWCGLVAQTEAPVVVSHVQDSEEARSELVRALGMRAYVCNPLRVGDRLLGTLSFGVRNRDAFSSEELEFLRTMSHYVAVALERMRAEADLRDEARRKDEFLAMLAHELRNPLSPLASAVEIMRTRPSYEQGVRAREVVERQLRRMSRLIDDLLDVSRINTGKIRLQPERLDLIPVVEGALESVAEVVAAAGHTLEVRFPPAPVPVEVDPVRLEQVVINLVHNAAKYTEPGGRLSVIVETDSTHAYLRVRDTGIGISPDLLARVFDLFTQGERTLDRSQGGLGLGLTLVRNLVQLHGGAVEAFSDGPGRGSEFRITLPLQEPPAASPALPAAPSPVHTPAPQRSGDPAPTSRRILVVDDNRDSADTLAELIELWGFEVNTAYDGLEGLRRAIEWEPGLVFLDIGMPGLNGYEVARRLRAEGRLHHMTLVALTGYGQPEDIERSHAAGFDHHLVKPVEISQLEQLLPHRRSKVFPARGVS